MAGTIADETLLPIHLAYGASAAKRQGCEYDVADAQVLRYGSSQAVDVVRRSTPDILVSWLALPSLHDDLALLDEIKRAVPGVVVVALGAVCNVMPEEVLLKSNVDMAVCGWYPHYNLISQAIQVLRSSGPGQAAFDKIGGARYLKQGQMVQSPIEPCEETLDELALDVYRQLPIQKYLRDVPDIRGSTIKCISIATSTGCPYACMYCPYPIGYGRKVTHKSIPRILDELESLKTNFAVTGFSFRDQLFTHNKQRVEDLCDEMVRRDLNVKWHVEARADEVTDGLLTKMRRAGCFRIHYGVETGSPEMLRKTGKPGLEIDMAKKAFKMTKEMGIATTAHMMLGLPGENQETLKISLDLLCQINPDVASLNVTTPYPGTKLFRMADEKGWLSTRDWSRYTSFDAIMRTDELTTAQLSEARKVMRRRFRNFKLRHDSEYRRLYLKALPKAVLGRLASLFRS
ncbi:MAG: radical SAM protein [Dehalococcoidia bacterium]|nr:radical SAM protein [Dehalococcoidia bacterium]